jgi:hypothetical protein
MNGSPYELVDSPFAKDKMEAWRAQSIATGASGALAAFHRLYEMVRNDAADAAARADEAKAREALVAHLCDQVSEMQERINRLADTLEARQRADAEAARHQRRFDAEEITLPPDLSEKQTLAPPAKIADETHHPGGELHSVDPKEEPSLEDADNIGDLPRELQDPPTPPTEPKGSVYPQPTALFGN